MKPVGTTLTLADLLVHFDAIVRRHAMGILKRLAVLVANKIMP